LALQTGGVAYINDLPLGRDGLGNELADRCVDLFGRLAVRAGLLVERGLQGLEPR